MDIFPISPLKSLYILQILRVLMMNERQYFKKGQQLQRISTEKRLGQKPLLKTICHLWRLNDTLKFCEKNNKLKIQMTVSASGPIHTCNLLSMNYCVNISVHTPLQNFSVNAKLDQIASVKLPTQYSTTHYSTISLHKCSLLINRRCEWTLGKEVVLVDCDWLELLVFPLAPTLVELAAEENDCDDSAAEDHTADEGRGVEVLTAVTLGRGRRGYCRRRCR